MKHLAKKAQVLLAFACVLCVCLGMVFLGGALTNAKAADATLVDGCEQVTAEPAGLLHLETGKVKKMTYHGLYKVDGKIAYYFSNAAENGAGETRFATKGTDTTPDSGLRIYDVDHRVTKITFDYKVKNSSTTAVADDKVSKYLLQVYGPNNVADSTAHDKYNGRGWSAVDYTVDQSWQTMSIELTEDDRDIFCGFIFKMGGLTGELLIADIRVELESDLGNLAQATEVPQGILHMETGKVKKMTYNGVYKVDGKVAYHYENANPGEEDNGETRFVTAGTDTTKKNPDTGKYYFEQYNAYSYSFDYKIKNICTNGVADLPEKSYITQVIGIDGSYDVIEFTPVLDGEWHTYTYVMTEAQTAKFAGFIVKMGGLDGEMLLANINVVRRDWVAGCEEATEPAGILHLETGKVKKMTYNGVYNVDGKVAYHFYNENPGEKDNGEARFVTAGTDTTKKNPDTGKYYFEQYNAYSYSFDYKIKNTCTNNVADVDNQYITQVLGTDGSYDIIEFTPVLDDEWHTYTYVMTEAQTAKFAGFIVKMGGLDGEMLIANVNVEKRTMISGCEEATEPVGVLHIEDGKTKAMTYNGIYNVDGKVAYHFENENPALGNAETRFVTDGTNTKPSNSADRTYGYYNAYSVSFDYKIKNSDTTVITGDGANAPYFAQVLTNGGKYLPLVFAPAADGEWHTQTFTFTKEQSDVFAGLILKMGGLDGEMLVANIVVEERTMISGCEKVTAEPAGLLHIEEGKVKEMTYHGLYNVDGKVAYYFSNTAKTGAGETRFATEGTDTTPSGGSRIYAVNHKVTKITFSYKVKNSSTAVVKDKEESRYLLQIYGPNNVVGSTSPDKYNGRGWTAVDYTTNSDWQTMSIELTEDDRDIFSGFIFKMGGLKGELLIADIRVETDEVAPVITVEKETATECNIGDLPSIKATANDAVDGNVNVTVAYQDGALDAEGKLVYGKWKVTLTAKDIAGNIATKEIEINVKDNVAPVITAKNEVEFRHGTEFDAAKLEISVDDNINGNIPGYEVVLQDGALKNGKLQSGIWKVTISATDDAGNNASKNVDIIVTFVSGLETTDEAVDVLHIETKKAKNLTYHGVYEVDGKKAYYASNEVAEGQGKNQELRFSYGKTDTSASSSADRIYESYKAKKVTFEYKIVNANKTLNVDDVAARYIVQTFGVISENSKTCKYFGHTFEPVEDGEWHKYELVFTAEDKSILFSGIIIKAGGLEGEILVANIVVEDSVAPVITVDENNKTEYTVGEELNILASATDAHDGVVKIEETLPEGMLDANGKLVEGNWNVILTATDMFGNEAAETITITVKKAQKPDESTSDESTSEEPSSDEPASEEPSSSEKPSSDKPASDKESGGSAITGGCFGSVSGVAGLAVVMLMAGAFVIAKKKKD